MTNFTINGFQGGGAQSATASTSIAYATAHMPPTYEMETGWHVHPPRPHAQHHATRVVPRFEPERLDPALPMDWIMFLPVAMIVAAHLTVRRASRFIAVRHVL